MSGKPLNKNRVILASAGSRKTTQLVEEALAIPDERVLITTYTLENVTQIREYLIQKAGCIPPHIKVLSWYSFLLQDGVRPYRSSVTTGARIGTIVFEDLPPIMRSVRKAEANRYYLTRTGNIYRDRVAEFVCQADDASGGLVTKRLERIYDHVFIDELQDLAAYDLVLFEKLLQSSTEITAVGDPRQSTYTTNRGSKNLKYKGSGIVNWLHERQAKGLVEVSERAESFRCNRAICEFADALYPGMTKTTSRNHEETGHDGIFFVPPAEIGSYMKEFQPMVLRHSRRTDTMGLAAINFGASKGRTYPRVLIFPTKPMMKYFKTRKPEDAGDLAKFYVAVTRARHSVAFVADGK